MFEVYVHPRTIVQYVYSGAYIRSTYLRTLYYIKKTIGRSEERRVGKECRSR